MIFLIVFYITLHQENVYNLIYVKLGTYCCEYVLSLDIPIKIEYFEMQDESKEYKYWYNKSNNMSIYTRKSTV